jgi:predicted small lipoprotein YifL
MQQLRWLLAAVALASIVSACGASKPDPNAPKSGTDQNAPNQNSDPDSRRSMGR